jgi:hypothetical protein
LMDKPIIHDDMYNFVINDPCSMTKNGLVITKMS